MTALFQARPDARLYIGVAAAALIEGLIALALVAHFEGWAP